MRFSILDKYDSMSSRVTTSSITFQCKAKYIPSADGGLRLASVQQFNIPKFRADGYEDVSPRNRPKREKKKEAVYIPDSYNNGTSSSFIELSDDVDLDELCKEMKHRGRAIRRAKVAAMDYILCNADLDMFVTLTYGEDENTDRCDYNECYSVLRNWLSNRVSRKGLKYVAVCERQKKGGIHFHLLCNEEALELLRAKSPYTGKPLFHNGKALYNIADWSAGFSSAECISGEDCRDKVAKYIFKYMSKESFLKLGGRYFLHGGKLLKPKYVLGDTPTELFNGSEIVHEREVELPDGLLWKEWSFI